MTTIITARIVIATATLAVQTHRKAAPISAVRRVETAIVLLPLLLYERIWRVLALESRTPAAAAMRMLAAATFLKPAVVMVRADATLVCS